MKPISEKEILIYSRQVIVPQFGDSGT